MEWQAVVVALQILMLAIGWFLFQQARAELSARAAETPVLAEVKALQRSIRQLLQELENASDAASARLESRCHTARDLLSELDDRLDRLSSALAVAQATPVNAAPGSAPAVFMQIEAQPHAIPEQAHAATGARLTRMPAATPGRETRPADREIIYARADQGETALQIAQVVGMSEGEVETLLGLRVRLR